MPTSSGGVALITVVSTPTGWSEKTVMISVAAWPVVGPLIPERNGGGCASGLGAPVVEGGLISLRSPSPAAALRAALDVIAVFPVLLRAAALRRFR